MGGSSQLCALVETVNVCIIILWWDGEVCVLFWTLSLSLPKIDICCGTGTIGLYLSKVYIYQSAPFCDWNDFTRGGGSFG